MDIDFELVKKIAGEPFAQQLTIWTTSLAVASFIHSGRVKKEMSNITSALVKLGESLRQDLKSQSDRIGTLETRIDKIEEKHKTT